MLASINLHTKGWPVMLFHRPAFFVCVVYFFHSPEAPQDEGVFMARELALPVIIISNW